MTVPTYWVATLGASTEYFDVAGAKTRALHIGDGPAVIMLHGLGGHLENFVYTVGPLAKAAGMHVYAIDLLGQGMNPRPDKPYDFWDMVDHVANFIDAIDAKKAHVVGLSLGGLVGAWLAQRHPDKVDKLCMTTTFGFFVEGMPREEIEATFGKIRDANLKAMRTPTLDSVRERLRPLATNPAAVSEEMVGVRYQVYTLPNAEKSMSDFLDNFHRDRWDILLTPERLQAIKKKTMVIWGDKNNPPPDYAQRASQYIPQSQFHSCANCGHWPHLEAQDEYIEVLSRFLKE